MQPKRMSLTLQAKTAIKQQVDHLLQADYRFLSEHPHQPQAVLQCHVVRNNPVLHQYIQVVEQEYHVPNPLHSHHDNPSSRKKLELSMLSVRREQQEGANAEGTRKRLTLTAKKQSNESSRLQPSQNSGENLIVMTPKFFNWEHDSSQAPSNGIPGSSEQLSRDPSLNRIPSKDKPVRPDRNRSTAKKNASLDDSHLSSHNFESRVTIKKHEASGEPSQDCIIDSSDSLHRNPIIAKMHRKSQDDCSRPSRVSDPKHRLKIKEAYRYCIGCEAPVLEANIRTHERECTAFQEISALPSNALVLQAVRRKIEAVEARLPLQAQQTQQSHAAEIRERSASLVRESRRRGERSSESAAFGAEYAGMMEIGRKWCLSLEEANKLRWFTRIAQKLEQLVATQPE